MLDQYAEYEMLVSEGQPAGGAAQAEEGEEEREALAGLEERRTDKEQ